MANKILTPVSLWSDFDASLPPRESIAGEMRMDNLKFSDVYFSGRETACGRVRIFGTTCVLEGGGSRPALLLLSDPKRMVDAGFAAFFARKGYFVLSVDLGGRRDAENFTAYPECVSYADYESAGDHYYRADPTAKETCWYEWTSAARYAVSYLLSRADVTGVGVLGIKDGGNVALQVLGTDSRVKCGASLFGAGWLAYRGKSKFAGEAGEIEMNDERYRFLAGVDAHAYAQFVAAPFLLLTSTNNRRFDFDRAGDTLARLESQEESYLNCSVRYDGILGDTCEKDLELFFAKHLLGEDVRLPSALQLELALEGDRAVARLRADGEDLSSCAVYFSEGVCDPALRSWRRAEEAGREEDGTFRFTYDYYAGSGAVFAFARAGYRNGFTQATEVLCRRTEGGGRSVPDRVLYSGRQGQGSFTVDRPADGDLIGGVFLTDPDPVYVKKGPMGIAGIGSRYGLRTFKPGSPRYRAGENAALKFDLYAPLATTVELSAYVDYLGAKKEVYRAVVNVRGGEHWNDFFLTPADFKAEDSRGLDGFSRVQVLTLRSEGEFLLNNMLWV